MRPAPAPVRVLAALAMLATVMLLASLLPFGVSSMPFYAAPLVGGALGGLLAGALLTERRWAVRLCLAGSALLGAWVLVQVVVEAVTVGMERVGGETFLVLVPLAGAGATAWMHAAPGEAPPAERAPWPLWLSLGVAAALLGLLALPWAVGESMGGFLSKSPGPSAAYPGFRLTVGAMAGGLALAAAGALLVARRGVLPVRVAALCLLGAALCALVPFLGVEVCTLEFLSSRCLPAPEGQPAAGVAAALGLVASAYLAFSTRPGKA